MFLANLADDISMAFMSVVVFPVVYLHFEFIQNFICLFCLYSSYNKIFILSVNPHTVFRIPEISFINFVMPSTTNFRCNIFRQSM